MLEFGAIEEIGRGDRLFDVGAAGRKFVEKFCKNCSF